MQFQNKQTGYEAIIKFWGANHPRNRMPPTAECWQTKIKIEIIFYEEMIFDVSQRKVSHPCADALKLENTLPFLRNKNKKFKKIK